MIVKNKCSIKILSIVVSLFLLLQIGCFNNKINDSPILYDTSLMDYYGKYKLELPFEIQFQSGLLGEIIKDIFSNPSIAYDGDSVGFCLIKPKTMP